MKFRTALPRSAEQQREQVMMSKQLRQCDGRALELDLNALQRREPDVAALAKLYRELVSVLCSRNWVRRGGFVRTCGCGFNSEGRLCAVCGCQRNFVHTWPSCL